MDATDVDGVLALVHEHWHGWKPTPADLARWRTVLTPLTAGPVLDAVRSLADDERPRPSLREVVDAASAVARRTGRPLRDVPDELEAARAKARIAEIRAVLRGERGQMRMEA